MKGNKGITLLALTITIIILLLLAGVALSVLGDGGILKNAENVAEQSKIEKMQSKIEEIVVKKWTSANREVTIEQIIEELEKKGIINEGDGNPDNGQVKTQPDGYIYEIKEKSDGGWKIEYVGQGEIDKSAITISITGNTTKPTTKVTLTIKGSSIAGITKYTPGSGIEKTYENETNQIEETCEITANGTYTFTIENIKGKTVSKTITINNIIDGEIQISASPATITSSNVRITVIWPSGTSTATKQISTNGGASWGTYTGDKSTVTVSSNCTVKARIISGTEEIKTATITVNNIDKNAPIVTAKQTSVTIDEGDSNSISAYFTVNQNGIAGITKTEYVDTSNSNTSVTNTNTLSVGTHVIKCTVVKETGTTASATMTIVIKKENKTIANVPDLDYFYKDNTYYVTWDLSQSPYDINDTISINEPEPNNWYDYTAGINQWANIKTTGGGNDCYWVWIPRYAYKVPNRSSTAQTIEIKFLQGKTNIPIGETNEITNTTPTPGTWVVHPAFTNEGNGGLGELSGFWVAKFEASSNSSEVVENPTEEQLKIDGGSTLDTDLKVRIKPNVTSWRNISVLSIQKVCSNMVENEGSLDGANVYAHMMKNTEWGACAYLSRSIYGKNAPVFNNPYYNYSSYYGAGVVGYYNSPITGLCGMYQDTSTSSYEETSYTDTIKYKYNTKNGVNASTSGNVYGIYDMAGGAAEYVGGIYAEPSTTAYIGKIYKFDFDIYGSYDNTKYGDAVFETSTSVGATANSSWDSDQSQFVTANYPIFLRGGHSIDRWDAGIFAFHIGSGEANMAYGFRPVVIP